MKLYDFTVFSLLTLLLIGNGCNHIKLTHSPEISESPEGSQTGDVTDSNSSEESKADLGPGNALVADRSSFAELRQQIPKDRQRVNDEEAVISELFVGRAQPDWKIREKFDRMLRIKREAQQKEMRKQRESFDNALKKRRDEFQKKQADDRAEFQRQKKSREERRSFYAEQESQRLEFNKQLKDERDQFEDQMRQRSRDFAAYTREKSAEFTERLRAYHESEKLKLKEKKLDTPPN